MTFRRVTLPLIGRGIGAGAFLAFMASFDNVPVSLFLADERTEVLPIHLWQQIETNLDVRTAAVSGLIVIFTLVLMLWPSASRASRGRCDRRKHPGISIYVVDVSRGLLGDARRKLPLVPFLNVVTFDFGVDDPQQRYHLPMKCTPWDYSCFRGGA